MKTITFSLDKAKVLETVYAFSAMRTYHRDAPKPLGRDEAPALMRLMEPRQSTLWQNCCGSYMMPMCMERIASRLR